MRQINLGADYALYSQQTVKNGGKAAMHSVISDDGKQKQIRTSSVHTF